MIIGAAMGVVTQLLLMGFYLIEAIVLSIAYNGIMPQIAEKFEFTLPFDHVSVWFTWGVFILIHFVGRFIGMIVPRLGNSVSQKNENNPKNSKG